MNSLDNLIAWLGRLHFADDQVAGLNAKSADIPLLKQAISLGWLEDRGILRELQCPECKAVHKVQVVQQGAGFALACPRLRGVIFDRSDVATLKVSFSRLLDQMQVSLTGGPRRRQTYADGHLVNLGLVDATDAVAEWNALFGFGLEEELVLGAALDAMAKQVPQGPGLLVTADHLPRALPLPRGYTLVRPSDIWRLTPEGLGLCKDAIAPLLGHKPKRTTGAGRASRREDVRRAIEVVRSAHGWPVIPADQCRLLENHWPKTFGPKPGRSTIFAHLKTLTAEAVPPIQKSRNPD